MQTGGAGFASERGGSEGKVEASERGVRRGVEGRATAGERRPRRGRIPQAVQAARSEPPPSRTLVRRCPALIEALSLALPAPFGVDCIDLVSDLLTDPLTGRHSVAIFAS